MRHRIGIVGLGSIAERVYLPLLGADDRVEIVAVVSRRPQAVRRVCERHRIPVGTTDPGELLALGPELVFVHTATEAHHGTVMPCLRAGVHVYVDKPLSYDLGEAEEMADAAGKRGLLLAVGFNRRFAPLYRHARDQVPRPSHIFAAKHRTSVQNAPAAETRYDDLIHIVDLLHWLGGDVTVTSYHERTDAGGRLTLAAGTAALGAAYGMFTMDRGAGADLERLEIHGGGVSARVEDLGSLWVARDGAMTLTRPGGWQSIAERRGFTALVDHVLDSLADPASCEVAAGKVLGTHRTIERLAAPAG